MFHRTSIGKSVSIFMMLTCLFAAPVARTEAVYTWVDEGGVRHFSQQPPEDQDYELKDVKVRLPTTPAPASAAGTTSGQPGSLDQRVDDFLTEQDAAQQARKLSQAEKAAMEQNCQIAQQNLITVESRTRVMVPDADGEMRQLTDDERMQAVGQAREDVEKFCQN
jgi:hypothetical protein